MPTTAFEWEYRWRVPILIASQPVLALSVHWLSDRDGCWYAPVFSVATGCAAVVIATLGILLRVQAVTDLHAHVMASHGPDVSRLVKTGIYGAVRNPLYISSLLLFGAYGLFFGWLWALGFVAFHWLRYQRIIRLEESFLRNQWGADFEDYCRQVPRWWPRWRSLLTESKLWISISMGGILPNLVYVAIWTGITVSALAGDLTWIIPIEAAGGAVQMVNIYRRRS